MLQRPYAGMGGSVGEDARLLAAEAGGPQFIHAFDSPSKLKKSSVDVGSSSSVLARSGLLALLNRRLEAWCKKLGPTFAVWLTAAAICTVYLLLERTPTDGFALGGGGGDNFQQAGTATDAVVGRDNVPFTRLENGLPHTKTAFVQQPGGLLDTPGIHDQKTVDAHGLQDSEGSTLSYLPDLSSYLPDLSAAYQNYTLVATDPIPIASSTGTAVNGGAASMGRRLAHLTNSIPKDTDSARLLLTPWARRRGDDRNDDAQYV